MKRFVRPVCPRCGCPACSVKMTARVVCALSEDGSLGRTMHVGRRVGKVEYVCGGGHVFGPNAPDQTRLQPSPESGCSEHDWIEETLREPTFQVAYGAKRTCRRCGKVQFADFCAGRVGGPWVDVPI